MNSESVYDLTASLLDGTPQPLSAWQGKVTLMVNTASFCGYTPQYAALQALHGELLPRGFAVLGFPSNDFGGQEPGTAEEISSFCTTRYAVTFPLFSKVRTTGPDKSPVYQRLTAGGEEPRWNFHKFLVGKDGRVRASFAHKVAPSDPALRAAIEAALAE